MCLAQGHNTVPPVRLKPATLRSGVKHSTTEPCIIGKNINLGTQRGGSDFNEIVPTSMRWF